MTKQYLEDALSVSKNAVTKAGEKLMQYYGNIETETKSNTGSNITDIVTKLDREIENFLAEELSEFDPTISFRGEEFGIRSESDNTWLVDPIDGTTHFVRGLPFCTIMLALVNNHKVVMSVIYDFVNKNMYSAIANQGAYMNNDRIHVSSRPLSEALVSFETRIENPENLQTYLKVRSVANLIQTMNSGFEFAMIASGKLDCRLAKNPYGNDWDFAAGSLLVTEAGGIATNMGLPTYDYRNHDYIIGNSVIHKELTNSKNALFPLTQ